jgi:hypothetical protein
MVSTGDPAGFVDMEQAIALAVAANSPLCVIAYVNLASALIERGELGRGFSLQTEGRRAAERFGFTAWQRHLGAERVLEDYWDAAEHAAAEFVAEDEAFARLQAARHLLGAGRHAEGRARLQGALAFHRDVNASAHIREAELLADRLMAI